MNNEYEDICSICHAPLNEDGTAEYCGGECDRQVSSEYDPMKELDFRDKGASSFMDETPKDYVDYNDLMENQDEAFREENFEDWLPENDPGYTDYD